jgi:hypothetical protein
MQVTLSELTSLIHRHITIRLYNNLLINKFQVVERKDNVKKIDNGCYQSNMGVYNNFSIAITSTYSPSNMP